MQHIRQASCLFLPAELGGRSRRTFSKSPGLELPEIIYDGIADLIQFFRIDNSRQLIPPQQIRRISLDNRCQDMPIRAYVFKYL